MQAVANDIKNKDAIEDANITKLLELIEQADAVVVGGASGMSSAGCDSYYDVNPTFLKYFGDLYEKFGPDSGGVFPMFYYPFEDRGQRFLATARIMQMVRESSVPQQYWDLKELLQGKDFFVVTTNQDQLFRRVFGDDKTAWIQGDWGWLQCSRRCHDSLYDNTQFVDEAIRSAHDCTLPEESIPCCPECGAPMSPWVRSPEFIERSMYNEQYRKYNDFLREHINDKVLFLELGVGSMTPMFIKQPFWNFVYKWQGEAHYVPITLGHAYVPREIADKSLPFDAEIDRVLHRAVELKRGERFDTQDESFKVEQEINGSDAVGVGW